MLNIERTAAKFLRENLITDHLDIIHCSDYLNLIVLSADVELKMKAICLTNRFPYVMEPQSSFRLAWDKFHMLAVIVLCIILPYQASFVREVSMDLISVYLILYSITVTDMLIQLSTAVKTKSRVISEPHLIVIHCCKDIYFLIDVFATAPLMYMFHVIMADPHITIIASLNVCIKVGKLLKISVSKTISCISLVAHSMR